MRCLLPRLLSLLVVTLVTCSQTTVWAMEHGVHKSTPSSFKLLQTFEDLSEQMDRLDVGAHLCIGLRAQEWEGFKGRFRRYVSFWGDHIRAFDFFVDRRKPDWVTAYIKRVLRSEPIAISVDDEHVPVIEISSYKRDDMYRIVTKDDSVKKFIFKPRAWKDYIRDCDELHDMLHDWRVLHSSGTNPGTGCPVETAQNQEAVDPQAIVLMLPMPYNEEPVTPQHSFGASPSHLALPSTSSRKEKLELWHNLDRVTADKLTHEASLCRQMQKASISQAVFPLDPPVASISDEDEIQRYAFLSTGMAGEIMQLVC